MDERDEFSLARTPLHVDWRTCGHTDCQGVCVGDGNACWAHLTPASLKEALASLAPGKSIDARGTDIKNDLLQKILSQMRGPDDRAARISVANFEGATFLNNARFDDAIIDIGYFGHTTFKGDGSFYGAKFSHYAAFHGATFEGIGDFGHAEFEQAAFKHIDFGPGPSFDDATFNGLTEFVNNHFKGFTEFTNIKVYKRAAFVRCKFDFYCSFQGAHFYDVAEIAGNQFLCTDVSFYRVVFDKKASLVMNEYECVAAFIETNFGGEVDFGESVFRNDAWFGESEFHNEVRFYGARFHGDILCHGAKFHGRVEFGGPESVEVDGDMRIDSAGGRGELILDGLTAAGIVEVDGTFKKVSCADAKLRGRVWFRLAGSDLWLDNTEFSGPTTVESAISASVNSNGDALALQTAVRLRSLKGTDAEHLTLVDIDLSHCEFAGLRRPELLHLAGRCRFAPMPRGLRMRLGSLPWWWTAREALFEEHVWRRSVHAPAKGEWMASDAGTEMTVIPPERLAVTYRQLRAGLEDAKNEPGAADMYYGEMEMRRAASHRWGERLLLWIYWLISGYGLRASRSLAALAGIILLAALAFKFVGFPGIITDYWSCLVYAAGSVLSLDLASQHLPDVLTEWGDVLRIGLRITGPVLLGLAALAMRGRVKR
jgi:uncharacterized protein YjbI with pentapeptide repeats